MKIRSAFILKYDQEEREPILEPRDPTHWKCRFQCLLTGFMVSLALFTLFPKEALSAVTIPVEAFIPSPEPSPSSEPTPEPSASSSPGGSPVEAPEIPMEAALMINMGMAGSAMWIRRYFQRKK